MTPRPFAGLIDRLGVIEGSAKSTATLRPECAYVDKRGVSQRAISRFDRAGVNLAPLFAAEKSIAHFAP